MQFTESRIIEASSVTNAEPLAEIADWLLRPCIPFARLIRDPKTSSSSHSGEVVTLDPDREKQESNKAYSELTIHQYEVMFGRFVKWMVDGDSPRNVLTIDADGINRFLASLEGRDPGEPGTGKRNADAMVVRREVLAETKRRYIQIFSLVMDRLVRAGFRKTNPSLVASKYITGPNVTPRLSFLSESEDERLQRYLLEDYDLSAGWERHRQRAMIAFMLGSGVIAKIARTATLKDFIFDDGDPGFDVAKVRRTDRVPSRIPLSAFCLPTVRQWLDERRRYLGSTGAANLGDELAFPSTPDGGELSHVALYNHVSACLRAIGYHGADLGPNVLRITFIRRQIIERVPDKDIISLSGVSEELLQRIKRMSLSRTLRAA